ncbi:IS3 family transposase, partial [Alkalicoccus chagannorensis]|uniref:IS3 family transposase n=1 Tax=Alkalicoccus chagannorensis TaxID=427072 RepID=UPI0039F0DF29
EHTIVKMCEALGVSVSGYHAFKNRIEGKEVSQRKQREDRLQERIKQHHYGSLQSYGAPRIHRALLEEGYVVSERKVGGLMRAMGLRSIASSPKQKTTDSNHSNRTYPNELKQHFQTKAPNEAWVTDITYIHTGEGFVYLNPVMDLYSRRIISYQVKD